MKTQIEIPTFALFGETTEFPDLLHCERIRDRAAPLDWEITPHRHDRMAQLICIFRGFGAAQVGDVAQSMAEKHFLWVPAETVHGFVFEAETDGIVLSIAEQTIASLPDSDGALAKALSVPIFHEMDSSLSATIRLLTATLALSSPFQRNAAFGLCQAVLANLAQHAPNKRAASRKMIKFDRLIAASRGQRRRISSFAEELAITPGQLTRIVRTEAQMSASDYIERGIMAEACRLLAFTRMPIAEIADRLGFTDPPHFSRRFRLLQRVSPSGYRARFASSNEELKGRVS